MWQFLSIERWVLRCFLLLDDLLLVVSEDDLLHPLDSLLHLVPDIAYDGAGDVAQRLGLASLGTEAGHFRNEAGTPPCGSVLEDVALELAVVCLALLRAHSDGIVNGVREFFGVPGVDDEAAVKGLGSAGELGEDHDTVIVALSGDIFVGDKVHAIAGGGDKADVGNSIECGELVKGDGLVQEVDGHKFNSTEATIDATHELVDNGAQVLVLLDILS